MRSFWVQKHNVWEADCISVTRSEETNGATKQSTTPSYKLGGLTLISHCHEKPQNLCTIQFI
jgi:hypothetical protein